MHDVLFPRVRLLDVSEQPTRRRTLTVAVTHPGTIAHNYNPITLTLIRKIIVAFRRILGLRSA